MVEYKCWVTDCEFVTVGNPHVDACISSMQTHFRGEHPRSYVSVQDLGSNIARFNWTFDEYMHSQLGREWETMNHPDVVYYARICAGDEYNGGNRRRVRAASSYCEATREAARAWIAANAERLEGAANQAAPLENADPALPVEDFVLEEDDAEDLL